MLNQHRQPHLSLPFCPLTFIHFYQSTPHQYLPDADDIINFYTIPQAMIQRESPFLQVQKLEAENERLRQLLDDSVAQCDGKHRIILDLESRLHQQNQRESLSPMRTLLEKEKTSGKEVQDIFVGESASVFAGREELDVGNQLAAEKEQQLANLRQLLTANEEVIATLQTSVTCLQHTVSQQVHTIGAMDGELNCLQRENLALQQALAQQQSAASERPQGEQQQQLNQEIIQKIQNIMIQNQKIRVILKQESRNMSIQKQQVKGILEQCEKNKKIISNYDWKLFCLQTEMELAVKERKMFKEESEEKEARLRQNAERMASLEEEMKLITEENNIFEMRISQQQTQIEDLLIQVDNLRDMQEHSDARDLHYRIKEKEEEIKELTSFLKEKLAETHQFKARCSQLESSLQDEKRKREKAEFQNYFTKQQLAEEKDRSQRQSERLSQMQQDEKKLREVLSDYKREKSALGDELQRLVLLANNKSKEIQKFSRKMDYFETSLKGKEKTIQILQAELKQAKAELRETRFMNQRCQEELEDIKEIMAVSDEKLKILKREAVDNIECEINYELELEQAKKRQIALESDNQTLLLKQKRQEETIDRLRGELESLSSLANKVKEITEFISAEPTQPEQTTTFEILAEEDSFQPTESLAQRQRAQLREKMQLYSAEVEAICHKYQ